MHRMTPAWTSESQASKLKITTTPQSLGAIVKSERDIMRKDEGLNGDLDGLPMLTWVMFMESLDDLLPSILDRACKGEL